MSNLESRLDRLESNVGFTEKPFFVLINGCKGEPLTDEEYARVRGEATARNPGQRFYCLCVERDENGTAVLR